MKRGKKGIDSPAQEGDEESQPGKMKVDAVLIAQVENWNRITLSVQMVDLGRFPQARPSKRRSSSVKSVSRFVAHVGFLVDTVDSGRGSDGGFG